MAFHKNFDRMISDDSFMDATLSFEDGSKKQVNKYILAAHSNFFKKKFAEYPGKVTFEIDKIFLKDFECYYTYIHQGHLCNLEGSKMINLFDCFWLLEDSTDIGQFICTWILESSQKNNYFINSHLVLYTKTKSARFSEIHETAKKAVQNQIKNIQNNKSLNNQLFETLTDIVDQNFIANMDQLNILKIFYYWMSSKNEERRKYSKQLNRKINFSKISKDNLDKFINTNIFFKEYIKE